MFKKLISIILCLLLIIGLVGCKTGKDNQDSSIDASSTETQKPKFDYTDPSIYTIDTLVSMGIEQPKMADPSIEKAADDKLKQITNNPDTLKPQDGGKYIYVSNSGADKLGYGFTEDMPFENIAYASLVAKPGDVILLRRGDFWRTQVIIKEGVSYGAYGEGNKPTIYGSTRDVSTQDWEEVRENVYKTQSGTGKDVGLIVFNHGKACGSKKRWDEELKKDYDFYCSGGYIYLYYSNGNPKNIFDSIEVCPTQQIIKMNSNATIQNWRVMYGGSHGISMNNAKNITIDGCIIGYIGGGFQSNSGFSQYTRYGNGIEVWGECDGYTVKNCHIFQCYDTGITFQLTSTQENNYYQKNILFENNLLEYNNYNIEYFLQVSNRTDSKMENVLIQDNILRYGGFGWGFYSRPDREYGTNVMSFPITKIENFVYKNNIFDRGSCLLIMLIADKNGKFPEFIGNTYAQTKNKAICEKQGKRYNLQKDGTMIIPDIIGDKTGKIIEY